MCATQVSATRWRRLFGSVEAFVILACLYGLILKFTWCYEASGTLAHTICRALMPWLVPMVWAFLAASVFLLVVSPFLLRSLKRTAAWAWAIGVAAFVCGLLLVIS